LLLQYHVERFSGIKATGLTEEELLVFFRANYFPEIDIDKVNKISGMDITL
jgi:ribosomal protein L5